MISSLTELAGSSGDDGLRERFGDKSVDLACLVADVEENGWGSKKPYGFMADMEDPSDVELRAVFDDLRARITTVVGERIVGALMCRSSAHGEKSGVNTTLSVLYDDNDVESSYQRFRAAFDRVRYNEEKPGDKIKPVLMQMLHGSFSYASKEYRTAGTLQWPNWPKFGESEPDDWAAVIKPLAEVVRETVERERIMYFTLMDKEGNDLGTLYVEDIDSIDSAVEGCFLDLYHSDSTEKGMFRLDSEGRIIDHEGEVVVDIGNEVYLSIQDVPTNPVIGADDEGFVVRSHGYAQPDKMSVAVCRGLPSYLVGKGLPPLRTDRPKGKMLYYFDPEDGSLVETVNLGHDFTKASTLMGDRYYQTHVEAFSVDSGQVVALPDDSQGHFHPRVAGSFDELLGIARYYSEERGVPVELEGVYSDGVLYVVQVGASPLPEDVIDSLSDVPDERIMYKSEAGRGALSFSGDIVVDDGSSLELGDEPCLVIGFDEKVTQCDAFLYIATDESVKAAAGRNLAMLDDHLAGYACQVVEEAAGERRYGGVFYVSDVDSFMQEMEPYVEVCGITKVIPNVRVEACKDGMQIFRV